MPTNRSRNRSLSLLTKKPRQVGLLVACGLIATSQAVAQQSAAPSHNVYGVPGLIDMPSAETSPDANLSTTVATFGDTTRTSLTFQITPRLSGSFRYSAVQNFNSPASVGGRYYDRSFEFRRTTDIQVPHLVGVAHECQRVERLEPEPWDVRLDAVVSDQHIYFPSPDAP